MVSEYRLASAAAQLWRRLMLPPALRRAVAPMIRGASRWFADHQRPFERRPLGDIVPGPLVMSGFVTDILGLGSAARMTDKALAQSGLEVMTHDIAFVRTTAIYEGLSFPAHLPGGVWLSHCNPPELNQLLCLYPRPDLEGRYRVGYWAWELERLPQPWVRAAASLHEIWAPSRFVADAVIRSVGTRKPPIVRVMPYPLPDLSQVTPDRARFGFTPDAFVVLVLLDLRSTRARKNPDSAIDAYLAAFPDDTADNVLICKVIGGASAPDELKALRARLGSRRDVRMLTDQLSDGDTHQLIASVDVVLSLHRSEGYGLTLAEAMNMGRVVVATGWSGNMDFMDEGCAIVVPYTLTPVHDPQGQYGGVDAVWAEADIPAAASALARLRAIPELRAELGAKARRRIADHQRIFYDEVAQMPWLHILV